MYDLVRELHFKISEKCSAVSADRGTDGIRLLIAMKDTAVDGIESSLK